MHYDIVYLLLSTVCGNDNYYGPMCENDDNQIEQWWFNSCVAAVRPMQLRYDIHDLW